MIYDAQNNMPILEIEDLDKSWLEGWKNAITNNSLRKEIENNERVSFKVLKNIISQSGTKILVKENINSDLSEKLNLLKNNKDRLIKLCGLALFGNKLRRIINPKELAPYIDIFGEKNIEIAIRLDIDYPEYEKISIEPSRLKEFVNQAGMRTIAGWSWGEAEPVGENIRLFLPKKFSSIKEKSNAIDSKIASYIISSLSKILNNEQQK